MNNRREASFLGAMLIFIGLLANKWTLERLVSTDAHIQSSGVIMVIALVQLTLVGVGLFLLVRRPALPYREIFLASFSTVLSLLMLELGARIWLDSIATDEQSALYRLGTEVDPAKLQWSPHHYLNYAPTPNFEKDGTRHNSRGFRDREFSIEKPEGTFRIVALGGSTTYTIRVPDNEKMFTRQLENILRDTYGFENVEIINAGVGGYDSWESLINLEFRALDLGPDLIMVYHGTNDVHNRLVTADAYIGDNSGRRKQWKAPPVSPIIEYSILFRIISSKLELGNFHRVGLESYVNSPYYQGQFSKNPAPDPMALLDSNPPIYFKRNLANMVSIARANAADTLLATWAYSPYFDDYAATPYYQYGFTQNNVAVEEVAQEYDVPIFDFAAVMPQEKDFWFDGRHVNEKGALAKAELFAEFMATSGVLDRATRAQSRSADGTAITQGSRQ